MDREFVAEVDQYRDLILYENSDMWMAPRDRNLPKILLLFRNLLFRVSEPDSGTTIDQFLDQLFSTLPKGSIPAWICIAFMRRIKGDVSLLGRAWYRLRFIKLSPF